MGIGTEAASGTLKIRHGLLSRADRPGGHPAIGASARGCPASIVYEPHNFGDRKTGIESYPRDRGYRIRELSGDSAAELVQ